ncbi:BON domain-containing protein [Phenylobacterium montanum]|uniref:BON domain-containing protein n=1 Tax=Phenylobacterium montanum TaxID=2823693 RepID=A0A975FWQ8_9CAUL|nr:BON domain-containing protein [Caulobacter sp. S6]QUD86893.1 BON domain-containing protein [Caulobacter sp. S6]
MSEQSLEEKARRVVEGLGHGAPVSVSVLDAVATLSGQVPDEETRHRIEQGLLQLADVRNVRNHLEIAPPGGPLRSQLLTLLEREGVALPSLQVQAQEGLIVLTGRADHWFDRDAAERLAWTLGGVRDVRNEITLPEGAATPENGDDEGLPD